MKLYASPMSGSSRKVQMFCEEAKISYQYCLIDLAKGAHHEPSFLALNPNGQVPVLDDGGFVLWESQAILRYLATKYQALSWYPVELKARGLIDQWMEWNTSRLAPECTKLVVNLFFAREKSNERVVGEVQKTLAKVLPILDHTCGRHAYVAGNSATLADLSIIPSISNLEMCRFDLSAYKNISRWYSGMKERPSFKATAPKERI